MGNSALTLPGVAMACAALAAVVWRLAFFRARRRTRGVVTGVVLGQRHKSGSGTTSRSRSVRVRFETLEGEQVDAEDDSAMGSAHEGQEVTLYYVPSIPSDVVISGFLRLWFLPLLFLVLAAAFLAAPRFLLSP